MKIAIIGQDQKKKREIIDKFLQLRTSYGKPAQSVHDQDIDVTDGLKYNEQWNELQRQLYNRMSLITTQMDKYSDKQYIIYCGHSIDVLVQAIVMSSIEEVSEQFVDKMIYWNRKLMKKLDMIYWLPSGDKVIVEKQTKDEQNQIQCQNQTQIQFEQWYDSQIQIVYQNIWNDYINNFEKSEVLPRQCPGIGVFQSSSQAQQLADIVQDLDQNSDAQAEMDNIAKLQSLVKDKRLLDQMKKVLSQKTIPLPSGQRVTIGGFQV